MDSWRWIELAVRPYCAVLVPAGLAIASIVGNRFGLSVHAAWDGAWTFAAISALAGMLVARRSAPPAARSRWSLWAAAAGCWLFGQLAWDVFVVAGMPPSPNLADLGYWAFALIVIVAILRARRESGFPRVLLALETVPLIAAAIALTSAELWPDVVGSSLPLVGRGSALVYPAVYVSAAVVTLQAMIAGSLRGRSWAFPLVLGGIVAQAIAFIFWSRSLLLGDSDLGAVVLSPLWVLGLFAIAIGGARAAHHPEVPAAGTEGPTERGGILPGAMFLLLIAALIRDHVTGAPAAAGIALTAGVLFSGTALIARGTFLARRARTLLDRERAALASLAEREAELARANQQLTEHSRRDALTGMGNRWALTDDLAKLDANARSSRETFALALCDVDHFKAYNDLLGHLAGDQALRAISATVRGALRSGDAAYRFGGEELLLVLRDTTRPEALAAAERVRAAVEAAALRHPGGVGGILTVSIGVAAGPGESGALVARADAALYAAKRDGRNRVCEEAAGNAVPLTGRRRRTVAEEPMPRHLRGMLEISRAAAAGRGGQPVLEALAETIRRELSFQLVAVNVPEEDRRHRRVVVVLGDDEARRALLGTRGSWDEIQALIDSEHERCGAVWLPSGSYDWSSDTVTWTPAGAAGFEADAWDPDDMLLLPLRDAAGDVLGIVSVDQPLSGRRPEDSELTVLMAVADHAGLALEHAQRDATETSAIRQQSQELRLAAAMLLAEALDLRDPGTSQHSVTVGMYARTIALELGLSSERVERIQSAGVLHDLGKLGIADAVLFKPGPLDDNEWREIRRHAEIGARILEHAGLTDIAGWVRAHHERVDGTGYPGRLPASDIPIEARILAVADSYEAMIAERPYRIPKTPAEACAELVRCAGTQFDPAVVDAFLTALEGDRQPAEDALSDAA
jgi:diguanylate cyclase (GGDEF)-like protein